jgi:tRNA (adenine-N(1)-)-methyltransferase non-catalytic subunit
LARPCPLLQPAKIGFLRLDTLSLLLSLANVGAHARMLVMDACGGMVTAAVAERLGGFGSVTAAYVGARPPGAEALRQFNFAPAVRGAVRTVPLQRLAEEAAAATAAAAAGAAAAAAAAAAVPLATAPAAAAESAQQNEQQQQEQGEQQQQQDGLRERQERPEAAGGGEAAEAQPAAPPANGEDAMQVDVRGQEQPEQAQAAAAAPAQQAQQAFSPFTSCILAAPALSPLSALSAVLPLLAPSAPFAVYCHWQQPLAEAMAELQRSRRAVALTLQECWWRDHQVGGIT